MCPSMFPHSPIASKMIMQKDKLSYSVTYELGSDITRLVLAKAKVSPFQSLSVDESRYLWKTTNGPGRDLEANVNQATKRTAYFQLCQQYEIATQYLC